MKITIEEPKIKNEWVVIVTGFSGSADAYHDVEVYAGNSQAFAERTYLEAVALSKVFPEGRGG